MICVNLIGMIFHNEEEFHLYLKGNRKREEEMLTGEVHRVDMAGLFGDGNSDMTWV